MGKYFEISKDIELKIINNSLESGQYIPSVRQLAKEYNVNTGTIQKAIKKLREQKLICNNSTTGNYVTNNWFKIENRKRILGNTELKKVVAKLEKLKVTSEELTDILNKIIS